MRSTFVTEAKNQGRQSDFEQVMLPPLDVAHDLARRPRRHNAGSSTLGEGRKEVGEGEPLGLGMHEARPKRVGHAAAAELPERARSSRPAQGRMPA
jgi:hypothetical protein